MHSHDYFALRSRENESTHSHQLQKIPEIVYDDRRRPFASTAIRYELTEKCTVCFGDFVEGQTLRLLPECEHKFHKRCVDRLLKFTKYKCPLCGSHGIEVKSYDNFDLN